MRAFADALDAVPMALAENSGLSPIETLANIKSRQAKEKNTRLGVDCMQTGSNGKCNSLQHPRPRRSFKLQITLPLSISKKYSRLLAPPFNLPVWRFPR